MDSSSEREKEVAPRSESLSDDKALCTLAQLRPLAARG